MSATLVCFDCGIVLEKICYWPGITRLRGFENIEDDDDHISCCSICYDIRDEAKIAGEILSSGETLNEENKRIAEETFRKLKASRERHEEDFDNYNELNSYTLEDEPESENYIKPAPMGSYSKDKK